MNPYPQNQPITSAASVNVSTDTTAFTVLAANVKRKGFIIWNRSGVTVYFRFSTDPTTSLFAFALTDGQCYEPPENAVPRYQINGISGSAVANGLCVTEIY